MTRTADQTPAPWLVVTHPDGTRELYGDASAGADSVSLAHLEEATSADERLMEEAPAMVAILRELKHCTGHPDYAVRGIATAALDVLARIDGGTDDPHG